MMDDLICKLILIILNQMPWEDENKLIIKKLNNKFLLWFKIN